jgi:hypothetical protein
MGPTIFTKNGNTLLNKFKKESKRSVYINSQNVNQYKTKKTQTPAGVQSKQTVVATNKVAGCLETLSANRHQAGVR